MDGGKPDLGSSFEYYKAIAKIQILGYGYRIYGDFGIPRADLFIQQFRAYMCFCIYWRFYEYGGKYDL